MNKRPGQNWIRNQIPSLGNTNPDKQAPPSDDPANADDSPNPEADASGQTDCFDKVGERRCRQTIRVRNSEPRRRPRRCGVEDLGRPRWPIETSVGRIAQADETNGKPASEDGRSDRRQGDPATDPESPPDSRLAMAPQQSETGQNAETNRHRLKITERLSARAAATAKQREVTGIRDRVVAIDELSGRS